MGKVIKNLKTKVKTANARRHLQHLTKEKSSTSGAESTNDKNKLLFNKTIASKKVISKKEKFRQKHKSLMNKFALIKKQQKEERARKNREKTAVIGDLRPLKDALPSLDELIKLSKSKENIKTGLKEVDESSKGPSLKQKFKQKKNKFINQINSYHALLNDPDFKKDPRGVISYHVKYTNGLIK